MRSSCTSCMPCWPQRPEGVSVHKHEVHVRATLRDAAQQLRRLQPSSRAGEPHHSTRHNDCNAKTWTGTACDATKTALSEHKKPSAPANSPWSAGCCGAPAQGAFAAAPPAAEKNSSLETLLWQPASTSRHATPRIRCTHAPVYRRQAAPAAPPGQTPPLLAPPPAAPLASLPCSKDMAAQRKALRHHRRGSKLFTGARGHVTLLQEGQWST